MNTGNPNCLEFKEFTLLVYIFVQDKTQHTKKQLNEKAIFGWQVLYLLAVKR